MEIVIQYEDQDGRVLSDPFMKLPTRKELPDYYEVIRKPVDISKILTKIEDGKYDDMDALERDFMLLCNNTQKYNEDGSLIHEDSIVLQSVFTNAREKLSNEWNDDAEDDQDEESNQAPSVSSKVVLKTGMSLFFEKLDFLFCFRSRNRRTLRMCLWQLQHPPNRPRKRKRNRLLPGANVSARRSTVPMKMTMMITNFKTNLSLLELFE